MAKNFEIFKKPICLLPFCMGKYDIAGKEMQESLVFDPYKARVKPKNISKNFASLMSMIIYDKILLPKIANIKAFS